MESAGNSDLLATGAAGTSVLHGVISFNIFLVSVSGLHHFARSSLLSKTCRIKWPQDQVCNVTRCALLTLESYGGTLLHNLAMLLSETLG